MSDISPEAHILIRQPDEPLQPPQPISTIAIDRLGLQPQRDRFTTAEVEEHFQRTLREWREYLAGFPGGPAGLAHREDIARMNVLEKNGFP